MKIIIKRIYDEYNESDGRRILVDRLWPRGVSKESGRIDLWLKELAPSDELRKWYSHEPDRWGEFKKKYFMEIESNINAMAVLMDEIKKHRTVTLLYSAKERVFNNAEALRDFLESRISV